MILYPRNGEDATVGNGLTVGLVAPNRAAMREFHRRALALGGTDEGAPGPRPFAPDAYAAYIRDWMATRSSHPAASRSDRIGCIRNSAALQYASLFLPKAACRTTCGCAAACQSSMAWVIPPPPKHRFCDATAGHTG